MQGQSKDVNVLSGAALQVGIDAPEVVRGKDGFGNFRLNVENFVNLNAMVIPKNIAISGKHDGSCQYGANHD